MLLEKFFGNFFSRKRLSSGIYRAILVDASVQESFEGSLNPVFDYILVSRENDKAYKFQESIADNITIGRSAEFFFFLESNHIVFDEYYELVGLVFDTVLQYDFVGGKEVPILTEKELIAPPPKY